METNEVVERYIDSIVEHSYDKHARKIRNELEDGKQIPQGPESFGDPKPTLLRGDMRQHISDMLEDPNTKYVINEANERIVFYNPDPLNGGTLTFNPAQMTSTRAKADGHAGTFFVEIENELGDALEAEKNSILGRTGSPAMERSVSDMGWAKHMEGYKGLIMSTPVLMPGEKGHTQRTFTDAESLRSDLAVDTTKAEINTTLNPQAIKSSALLDLGISAGVATILVVTGSTLAEAGEAVKPDTIKVGEEIIDGNYGEAAKMSYVVAAEGIGCYGGASIGAGIGAAAAGWGAIPGGIIGCVIGATGTGTGAQKIMDKHFSGETSQPVTDWQSIEKRSAAHTPPSELTELHDNRLAEESLVRSRNFNMNDKRAPVDVAQSEEYAQARQRGLNPEISSADDPILGGYDEGQNIGMILFCLNKNKEVKY